MRTDADVGTVVCAFSLALENSFRVGVARVLGLQEARVCLALTFHPVQEEACRQKDRHA